MKNSKISIIIIAKDEEKKLPDCLKSIEWADEVVVIDNDSRDKTAEIARKFGAKVITIKNGTYATRKNKGAQVAQGEWLLYVDADERVTPELRKEIEDRVLTNSRDTVIYAIPRNNIILGKELRYGGWWPDYVKHLIKKDALRGWKGDLHEEPVVKGGLEHLKGALLHLKHDNLSEMVEKTNAWSAIEARLMYESKHPPMNILRFITAVLREFWLRMIRQTAFLDGTVGIIYALYQVYSRFISYAKLWEKQISKSRHEYTNAHGLRE